MSMDEMKDLLVEVEENAELLESTGAGLKETIVCTIAQSLLGCVGSYFLGNKGYGCTATKECMATCN